MNFVKRAAFSLRARKGKTGILLGIFLVICTLLLGGFLLQDATARRQAEAGRRIGVDVTVRGAELTSRTVDTLGASPPVQRYNPMLRAVTEPQGLTPVVSNLPEPRRSERAGDGGKDGLTVYGIRDSGMLLDFATGTTTIVSGRALTEQDRARRVVLIEQRLAVRNRLKVGDRVTLASADGKRTAAFEIVGLYQDPRPDPPQWVAPSELSANQVYAPVAALTALGFGDRPEEAVFKVGSPGQVQQLRAEAARLLGARGFRFDVNDKAYRDQVLPLQRVGSFTAALVWLITLSGAVILSLIVAMTIRERRDELGMLLALGEKKWRLIGQHTVEVAAVLLPALALAALAGQSLAHRAGSALLAHEQHSVTADRIPSLAPLPQAPQVPQEAQAPQVRMDVGELGKVAGIGLGIALVSTVVPGIGILRLHPRSILTDTE
ncbi:ABC transporter permease [Streptacidiphilus sp. N1-12]|uniref:ABC transporter permease n=2 Tax=Streptacidiphilus alkalitolerans TaxID=3342712 RepID=A0ABV6VD62_9ACTN